MCDLIREKDETRLLTSRATQGASLLAKYSHKQAQYHTVAASDFFFFLPNSSDGVLRIFLSALLTSISCIYCILFNFPFYRKTTHLQGHIIKCAVIKHVLSISLKIFIIALSGL